MRDLLLGMMTCFMATTSLTASTTSFYIGTYTTATGSQGIYRASLDGETGAISAATLAVETHNPSYLCFPPDRRFLYAVDECAQGAVNAFKIESGGRLALLNSQSTLGEAPCHLSTDRDGKNLLAANYNGGNVVSFPIHADGSLGALSAMVLFTGSSSHPTRQTKPHAHSIYIDAENKRAYSCDLGSDSIWIHRFNPEDGSLKAHEPFQFKSTPGAGPRHIAMAPGGRRFYVINELNLTVSVLERNPDSGVLKPVQEIDALPSGVSREGVTAAAIRLHPNGHWLYVSSRGCDLIALYSVDGDGRLSWVEAVPAGVKSPRDFAIDPSGRWIVCSGQKDGRIVSFKLDPSNGKLTATGHSITVDSAVSILF